MKAHAFSSTLPVLLAFSLQASAEMAEVNLSEWDESAISTESGPCTLVYHEITSSDPQAARKDMEQFRQYVLSLNRKEIGLLLFVEGDVSVHTVFEYILSIRDKVNIKGVLFGKSR